MATVVVLEGTIVLEVDGTAEDDCTVVKDGITVVSGIIVEVVTSGVEETNTEVEEVDKIVVG